jgi:light-independent protochlorophyllide reductase subunit B
MGLEEHLIAMFRDDPEFHADAAPSHLPAAVPAPAISPAAAPQAEPDRGSPAREPATSAAWDAEAERELAKIPFFVRGKARRNTERYAREQGVPRITIETLYDAKAHFGR